MTYIPAHAQFRAFFKGAAGARGSFGALLYFEATKFVSWCCRQCSPQVTCPPPLARGKHRLLPKAFRTSIRWCVPALRLLCRSSENFNTPDKKQTSCRRVRVFLTSTNRGFGNNWVWWGVLDERWRREAEPVVTFSYTASLGPA